MSGNIIDEFREFFNEAIRSLQNGLIFFGGPSDYIRYIVDILLITLLMYSLLRVLRETRAWQLLKGIVLILFVSFVCILLQMEMVTFLFTNVLSLVAIAIVVVMQPELRRALESVGLRSFFSSTLSNAIAPAEEQGDIYTARLIDEIVDACVKMMHSYTGALIIFERTSKLNELVSQANVVALDSSVTSTMLQSIFYKGSPLHDGALVIQNGRITAARCHIPLSDNVSLKDGMGTRHRAALGASELGDAVAIAVSEERGTISIALDGSLYPMKNGEELKKNLLLLFGISEEKHYTLGRRIRDRYIQNKKEHHSFHRKKKIEKDENDGKSEKWKDTSSRSEIPVPVTARTERRKSKRISRLAKFFLFLLSLVISASLWVYIQVTTNPVVPNKTINLTLSFINEDVLQANGWAPEFPYTGVTIQLSGRKKELDKISSDANEDFTAFIDFAGTEGPGVHTYDVHIVSDRPFYYNIKMVNPDKYTMTIYEEGGKG